MKFSIITVCYNCEFFLEHCLRSIAAQTYDEIEHIIIDGASTDRTVALARQYPHVTKIVSEPDKGIFDAMNKGIGLATGDFIIFINADDALVAPTTLADAAKAIRAKPGGDVYYGSLEVRHLDGSSSVFRPPPPEDAPELMLTGCLPHQSTLASRKVFDRTGLFDLRYRYHADYDWFIKILADPNIDVRALPLTIASFSAGGASSQLEKGQPEVFEIQAATPLYATSKWDKIRIKAFQMAWLAERVEAARLRQALLAAQTGRATSVVFACRQALVSTLRVLAGYLKRLIK